MRKYLDDIGVYARPENSWGESKWTDTDDRKARWKEQQETYGFDDRETYSLDTTFYMWLYERVMMYKEVASEIVNLEDEHRKFTLNGEEYTQLAYINLLIDKLKFVLSSGVDIWDTEYEGSTKEIGYMWAELLPAMWW